MHWSTDLYPGKMRSILGETAMNFAQQHNHVTAILYNLIFISELALIQ
jgi:hypothetical protein